MPSTSSGVRSTSRSVGRPKLDLAGPASGSSSRQALLSDLEGFVRDEADVGGRVQAAPLRGQASARSSAAPRLQRGLPLGDGRSGSRGRSTASTRTRASARAGSSRTTRPACCAHSAREDPARGPAADPALRPRRCASCSASSRSAASTAPSAAGGATRGMVRGADDADVLPPGGSRPPTCSSARSSGRIVDDAREQAVDAVARRIRGGDVRHDPRAAGRLPGVLPVERRVPEIETADLTQHRAAGGDRGRRRRLRLRRRRPGEDARARRAVRPRGTPSATSRRTRCSRSRTHELAPPRSSRRASGPRAPAAGRPDLERGLNGAWISTIHAFCRRLLRRHALVAGIDPGFEVLVRRRGRPAPPGGLRATRWSGLAAQSPDVVDGSSPAYGRAAAPPADRRDGTRSCAPPAGRSRSPRAEGVDLASAAAEVVRREAAAVVSLAGATALRLGQTRQRGCDPPRPARGRGRRRRACSADLGSYRSAGQARRLRRLRRRARGRARARRPRGRLRRAPAGTLDALLRALRRGASPGAKRAGSWLDSSDLQLETRAGCSETRDDVREAVQERFREVLVDEFQDTNELQCALVDLVRRARAASLFFVGDEFQSIYRFRDADVERLPPPPRGGGADAASAIALTTELPLASRGACRREPPLRCAVRRRVPAARRSGGAFPELRAAEPSGRVPRDGRGGVAREAGGRSRARSRRGAVAERIAALVDVGLRRGRRRRPPVRLDGATPTSTSERSRRVEPGTTASTTGRRYYGEAQAVDVLAYLRLLRNRYDDVALSRGARLATRRRDERHARGGARRRAAAAALHGARARAAGGGRADGEARLSRPFASATTGSSRSRPGSRLPLLVEPSVVPSTTTTSRCSGATTARRRFANVRKLSGLRATSRRCAAPTSRRSCRNVEEQDARSPRRPSRTRRSRRRRRGRRAAAHHARGEGARVSRRRRGGRRSAARAGRRGARRAAGRSHRVPRCTARGDSSPDERLGGAAATAESGRGARGAPPRSSTSR